MYTYARGLKPYLQINSCWPLNLLTVHLFIVGKNIFRIAAKKKKKKASTVFCQFVTQYNIKQTSDEDKEKNFN